MTLNAPPSFTTGSPSDEFQKLLELNCLSGINHFRKILRSHLIFHGTFALVFVIEAACLLCLLNQEKSAYVAISLSTFILSVFAYLVLLFYFQAKKPEQFKQLKNWLMTFTKNALERDLSSSELHFIMTHVLFEFSHYFHFKELPKYFSLVQIDGLQRLIKKISFIIHWKDFQKMKELLLLQCINEHLALLKEDPTNLEVHGSLAGIYLSLAKIYKSMKYSITSIEHQKTTLQDLEEDTQRKVKRCIQRAIEEYTILNDLVPHDPWVLAQLASCHHEIEEFDFEIEYLEKILSLSDSSDEVQLRLASLYFQVGKHALGFKLYKSLKQHELKEADELMDDYIESLVEDNAN